MFRNIGFATVLLLGSHFMVTSRSAMAADGRGIGQPCGNDGANDACASDLVCVAGPSDFTATCQALPATCGGPDETRPHGGCPDGFTCSCPNGARCFVSGTCSPALACRLDQTSSCPASFACVSGADDSVFGQCDLVP
jgi:hypothetical protein